MHTEFGEQPFIVKIMHDVEVLVLFKYMFHVKGLDKIKTCINKSTSVRVLKTENGW